MTMTSTVAHAAAALRAAHAAADREMRLATASFDPTDQTPVFADGADFACENDG